jgi:acyl-CoA thioesterase-2
MVAAMSAAPVHTLADRLAVDPVEGRVDVFVSRQPPDPQHVFGGLLVAQALRSAQSTVPDGRDAHSLHASFVRAGTGGRVITYEVESTRDGSSFSTRRVVARQPGDGIPGEVVMVLTADFHDAEHGLEYETPATAGIPDPDDLPLGRVQSRVFESRVVPAPDGRSLLPHGTRSWFRPRVPLPDDPHVHLQALAYLSDHGPSRAAKAPHANRPRGSIARTVSLDHSVWLHRPVDVNGWLLFELAPVATGRGRGLSIGTVRTRDRVLVATVAQEVLLRPV